MNIFINNNLLLPKMFLFILAVNIKMNNCSSINKTKKYCVHFDLMEAPEDDLSSILTLSINVFINLYLQLASIVYYRKYSQRKLKPSNLLTCVCCSLTSLNSLCCYPRTMTFSNEIHMFCQIDISTQVILTSMTTIINHIVYGIRHRIMSRNRNSGQSFFHRLKNYLIYLNITFLIILCLVTTPLWIIKEKKDCVCRTIQNEMFLITLIPFGISSLLQAALLICILAPVISQWSKKGNPLNVMSSGQRNLTPMVVRLSVCTSCLIFTDIVFVLLAVTFPIIFKLPYYGILLTNLMINNFVLIVSFKDWRLRIIPFTWTSRSSNSQTTKNEAIVYAITATKSK